MRLGVARVDLNGEVAGTVGENDAKSAQARLNGIRKFRKNSSQNSARAASASAQVEVANMVQPRRLGPVALGERGQKLY